MKLRLLLLGLLTACVSLLACSSEPKKSAAEQHYAFAQTNLDRMEYDAALKNIEQMINAAGNGPLAQEGTVLEVVLQAAMADGAKTMAEAYEQGVKQPAAAGRYGDFIKMRSAYYGVARVRLLNAMEGAMKQRSKLGAAPVKLQIRFPDFSGTPPPALAAVREGRWVDDTERFRAELETVRTAFARTVARLAGAGDDVHKGHAAFDATQQFDPRVYLLELSDQFLRISEIFEPKALGDMRYRRICYEVIRDNMDLTQKLLAATPDKDMEKRVLQIKGDCEKGLKKLPAE